MLFIGTAFFLSFFSAQSFQTNSNATVTPIPVETSLDKSVYEPGDRVTLTVKNQFIEGQHLRIEVVKGVTETRIFYTLQEITGNTTTVAFDLPAADSFYQYLVRVDVIGPDASLSGSSVAMIFTRENASKVDVSNLSVDKENVRPGEPVHVEFQVKDGLGNDIPWATPSIGLCSADAEKPNYVIVTPDNAAELNSDCIQYYADISSATDLFDINLGVLNSVPPGQYKLTIWANPLFSGNGGFEAARQTVDLEVSGEPVNPDMPVPEASVIISESKDVPPQFHNNQSSDGYLTYGQDAIFSLQYRGIPSANSFHWAIVDPSGKVIHESQIPVIGSGSGEQLAIEKILPITDKLQRGRYEVYIDAVQEDGGSSYVPYSVMTSFFVTDLQKYDVAITEGNPYEVYFQGIDLDSSNFAFNQSEKNISFDIKKLEGEFDNRHPYGRDNLGWALVSIERPLLSEPFTAHIDGKQINAYVWDRSDDDQTTMLKVGPIDKDGKLIIHAAYAAPEFPVAQLLAASSIGGLLVMLSVYKKKLFSKQP